MRCYCPCRKDKKTEVQRGCLAPDHAGSKPWSQSLTWRSMSFLTLKLMLLLAMLLTELLNKQHTYSVMFKMHLGSCSVVEWNGNHGCSVWHWEISGQGPLNHCLCTLGQDPTSVASWKNLILDSSFVRTQQAVVPFRTNPSSTGMHGRCHGRTLARAAGSTSDWGGPCTFCFLTCKTGGFFHSRGGSFRSYPSQNSTELCMMLPASTWNIA